MPATLAPPKTASRQPAADDQPRLIGPQTQSVLANDDQFVVIDDVPIFPEHSTKAKDGRQLVFDRAALKALCDNCNRRILATGDYATIIVGHTVDPKLLREGRAKNPPAVGFAGPYKLGLLGPPGYQRWCIFARFRIYRDKWDEVRQFPRRSPELWLMPSYEEMFLDPIALLSETPRLDMGILYSAQLHAGGIEGVLVEKYAAAAPAAGSVFVPSDKYQGENPMAASADEIVQGVMQALDSCDWVQWCKQQMQAAAAPAAMGTAPAPDVNAPPPPAPEAAPPPGAPADAPPPPADATATPPAAPAAAPPAAAAPAAPPPPEERSKADVDKNAAACPPATPVARVKYDAEDDDDKKDDADPVVQEKPGDDDDDGDDDEDLEPEKDETVEQYRARSKSFRRNRRKGAKVNYSADVNAALTQVVSAAMNPLVSRLDTLDKQLASDRTTMKNVERYAALESLARKGYAIDPAEVLETLKYSADGSGISDEEFNRHIEILTKTGNRAPIDAPLLPVPESIEQYSAQPGQGPKTASEDHRKQAMDLCAKAYETGKQPDYVKTLHNVVGGKSEAALVS